MDVRQVDGTGIEVDQSHRNPLTFQSRKLVEVDPSDLEAIDESIRLGAAKTEGEVLWVEQRDLFLEDEGFCGHGRGERLRRMSWEYIMGRKRHGNFISMLILYGATYVNNDIPT